MPRRIPLCSCSSAAALAALLVLVAGCAPAGGRLESPQPPPPPRATTPASQPAAPALRTRVLPLTHLTAGPLRQELAPLVSPGGVLAASDDANCLIVVDTPENLDRIVGIVTALEERPASIKRSTLKYVPAKDAAELLNQLYNEPPGLRRASPAVVRALADVQTNTVFIAGPPDQVGTALKVLYDLDQTPLDGGPAFFIYPLRHAVASDLQKVLREMFGPGGIRNTPAPGFGEPPSPVLAITADTRTNSLLIAVGMQWEVQVRDVLASLDKPADTTLPATEPASPPPVQGRR
jgi:type II secretory pathway component GspD/PulD (secretin)